MGDGMEMQLLSNEELSSSSNNNEEVSEDYEVSKTTLFRRCNCWPYMGITLATISSLFFSLCSLIVKAMKDVSPSELAVCRFVGVLLPSLPILIWENVDVFPKGYRIMLLSRSFVGATGLILSFYAFRYMHLADASVIVFSVPVFVAIFARIFLKEPCGLFNVLTIFLTLIGVLLITRPSVLFDESRSVLGKKNSNEPLGALAAFGATLFGASAYVLLRALNSLHFAVVMANFGFFALIETLIVTFLTSTVLWPPKLFLDRVLIIALAIFSFLGQILLTLAFKFENAGAISVARTSDIVFAFVWQMVFFKEVPAISTVLGAFYVIMSVSIIALRKWIILLPNGDPRKRKLSFITR